MSKELKPCSFCKENKAKGDFLLSLCEEKEEKLTNLKKVLKPLLRDLKHTHWNQMEWMSHIENLGQILKTL